VTPITHFPGRRLCFSLRGREDARVFNIGTYGSGLKHTLKKINAPADRHDCRFAGA
jgi:hypothetical protein